MSRPGETIIRSFVLVLAAGLSLAASPWPGVGAAAAEPPAPDWRRSPYGEGDTLGAANNLTPAGVRAAVGLVRQGKVYSLAVPTGPDTPAYGTRRYSVEILRNPPGDPGPNGSERVTSHDERVTTSMGVGTQIDGLGHLGIDHHYYNGLTGAELNTPEGFRKLDLAGLPPIVTRGVVLDMTRHFRKAMLEPGDVFNRAEIEAAARAQGLQIRKGDVVLFHTGWMRMAGIDKRRFSTTEPGLGEEGANYLADLGVVAIGADTIALEALPPVDARRPFIVHQTLLAKKGVYILEAINTAPLIADGVKEFLFVLGQPRFVGTVQAVVNPIAIR